AGWRAMGVVGFGAQVVGDWVFRSVCASPLMIGPDTMLDEVTQLRWMARHGCRGLWGSSSGRLGFSLSLC
ncbi:hypothetical protein CBG35_19215, partial [Vibrio cholerae O139]